MWEYTDKVREYFLNPKNVGEIADADAVGEVGSLACGDALKLYLKVDENDRIVDAKFQTFGCASAIASSSALTELIKGKTLDEAMQVTNKEIAGYLGGLPKEKMHCSVMGQEALEAAVKNFRGQEVTTHNPEDLDGELVCHCFGVTDTQIRRAVLENNLTTLEEVTTLHQGRRRMRRMPRPDRGNHRRGPWRGRQAGRRAQAAEADQPAADATRDDGHRGRHQPQSA